MSSIRKRVRQTSSGTKIAWLVDYRDCAGKRRAKQFQRKKDAEAWAVNAFGELQRGTHTPDSISITVTKAAELWLDSVRSSDREPTTIAAYEQHVRLHILPVCGGIKISQLSAPKVRSLLDGWLERLSRPMATRVFRSFKAILTEAQARGLVAQNVALAVKVANAPRKGSKVLIPSKGELRAILAAAATSETVMARAMVELIIYTGLRASEVRGLAWRSVDLRNGKVRVETPPSRIAATRVQHDPQ